jgi:hypothetical protein
LIPMIDAKAKANFETIKALPARRARAPNASGTRVEPNNNGIMI